MCIDYNQEKWGVLNLKHLILETKDFIVFIDNSEDLDWITTDDYDEKGPEIPAKHNEILNTVALLECKPIIHLSDKNRLNYKRLLGESLARSLEHDYKKAADILGQAEHYLVERGKELSRRWYLSRAGNTSAIIFTAGLILWVFRDYSTMVLGYTVFITSLSVIAGGLGALLSIIFRMGNESLDCLSGKDLHELESMYRIVAGMLSAFLASLLVRMEIFVPVFSKTSHLEIAIIVVGFIAGMSERFAPSILAKLDSKKFNK